jgi:hypothetical protein
VLAEVCGSDECHGAELAGVGPNTHFSSALSNRSRAETIGLRILDCALHILLYKSRYIVPTYQYLPNDASCFQLRYIYVEFNIFDSAQPHSDFVNSPHSSNLFRWLLRFPKAQEVKKYQVFQKPVTQVKKWSKAPSQEILYPLLWFKNERVAQDIQKRKDTLLYRILR